MNARNVCQILGEYPGESIPSKMLICWTPGAKYITSIAKMMRIADSYGIPVFNLACPETRARIETWLTK